MEIEGTDNKHNGHTIVMTPQEEEATKILKDNFSEEAMKNAKGGTGEPPVAPLQQWVDLISKELGTRLAPRGFKKLRNGQTVINADFITRDRFVNTGEAMVHVHNYFVQALGVRYDATAKEFDKAETELRVEYAALSWFRFKAKRKLQAQLIEAKAGRESFVAAVRILLNLRPQ